MSTIQIGGTDYPASKISELAIKATPSDTDQIEIETAGGASMRIEVGSIAHGDGSNISTITRIAASALGGHRAIRLNADGQAIYADCTVLDDASAVIGITTGAANQGDSAIIQTEGELIEPSWNWDIDAPVFLSAQGQLTQIQPASAFVLCIGVPLSATRLLIRIGEPILL